MNKEETIVNVVALTVGAAVGFGVGYYVQKRKYEAWFAQDQREQDLTRKEGVFSTPQGAVRELIGDTEEIVIEERQMSRDEVNELLIDAGYAPLNGEDTYDADQVLEETGVRIVDVPSVDIQTGEELEDVEDDGFAVQITGEQIVESIWTNSAAREDEAVSPTENEDATDMPPVDPNKPYVITVDQYMTDTQYEDNKMELVYFEGDDQMIDAAERLVNGVDDLIGHSNLQHFGLGSRDRNALYVRNDQKKMDFEILRDKRTYTEVVLGVKPEVTLGAKVRRMREDDQ